MSKKNCLSKPMAPPRKPEPAGEAGGTQTEVAELLIRMEALLQAGEPQKAVDLIARTKLRSPWLTNALGVCQLRLGNAQGALELFRRLVLAPSGLMIREDAPTVFKTNFAAALLAAGDVGGCLRALAQTAEDHPAVGKLKAAIQHWKKSLTFREKLDWYLGGQPARPVALDFAPGDLE